MSYNWLLSLSFENSACVSSPGIFVRSVMKYFSTAIASFVVCLTIAPNVVLGNNNFPSCVSDASDPDGDGYGYENSQSCVVNEETTNSSAAGAQGNCDYSDAARYDGWGYDAVTGQSCEPLQQDVQSDRFPLCSSSASDTDGDGYGWENGASCVTASSPNDNNDPSGDDPSFTNLETGLKVDLVRPRWMQHDFGVDVVCSTREFDGVEYVLTEADDIYVFDPFRSTVHIGLSSEIDESWGIVDGIYSGPGPLSGQQWVEIVETRRSVIPRTVYDFASIRIWQANNKFISCSTPSPIGVFIPTGTPLKHNVGDCDYTSAALYDGWGWNPDTLGSCAPLKQVNYGTSQDSLIAEFTGTLFGEVHTGTFTLTAPTEVRLSGYYYDIYQDYGHVSVSDSMGNRVFNRIDGIQCLDVGTYTVGISQPFVRVANGVLPYDYALRVSDNGGGCGTSTGVDSL